MPATMTRWVCRDMLITLAPRNRARPLMIDMSYNAYDESDEEGGGVLGGGVPLQAGQGPNKSTWPVTVVTKGLQPTYIVCHISSVIGY